MFGALESLTAASLRLTPTEWDAVGTYHGIEGVEAATRDAFEAWDWFWQEAEQFIEVGDDVVVLTHQHGRLKGTEREVESKAGELWTFRDGKVVRHKSFDSPAEALEAAGLRKGSSRLSLTAETGLASLRMSTRLNAPANSIWDRLRAAYATHQRLGEQLNVTPSDSPASPRARR